MGSCLTTSTAVAVKRNDDGSGEAHHYRCKSWSCDHCREVNRRKVVRIARESRPRALLTLTVSSKHYDRPEDAAAALKRGLRLLRLRLKRDMKLRNFEFMAVFEAHKSGWPHLHLLIRGSYLPWKRLQGMWEEITGSTHIDIRRIHSEGMAALYVAKYIGKDLHHFPGCKRWWRSHHFSDEMPEAYDPNNASGSYARFRLRWHYLKAAFEDAGYKFDIARSCRLTWSMQEEYQPPPEEIIRRALLIQSADIDYTPVDMGENIEEPAQ